MRKDQRHQVMEARRNGRTMITLLYTSRSHTLYLFHAQALLARVIVKYDRLLQYYCCGSVIEPHNRNRHIVSSSRRRHARTTD